MVRAVSLALLLTVAVPVSDVAAQTLRGSRSTMQRQNRVAREQDYTFLQTSSQVRRFAREGLLVRIPGNSNYGLASVSHPYARPAVKTFLERLGAQHRNACGERLIVTSLTRPLREQPRNASDLSVHPAGMAADLRISRKASCRRWLEKTLLQLEDNRVIDATRERRPAHYHVAVFPAAYERYVRKLEGDRPAVRLASTSTGTPVRAAAALPPKPDPVRIEDPAAVSKSAAVTPDGESGQAVDVGSLGGPSSEPALTSEQAVQISEAEGAGNEYRVNRGDTLWTIARRHGVSVEVLKVANGLRTSRIAAGQVISIPTEQAAR
jgi:LysM repeat protein